MWTIFFDIDGTLIRTGGAGLVSMLAVMNRRFQVDKLPQVPVHGRTDFGIWIDVFAHLQLPMPDDIQPLIEEYCNELESNLKANVGTLLPGVNRLLQQLQHESDVAICLLTGNAQSAARIKLKAFGLAEHFLEAEDRHQFVGGFGDSTPCRNEVAEQAVVSASQHLNGFQKSRMWVIGDTVRDIECARAIGANVMAVETGGDTISELNASHPDCVLRDLSETEKIVKRLLAG